MNDFNSQNNSEDEEYGKLSKINSAGLVNSTLSNLWNDFFRHFRDGKYLSANNDLDCLWMILGGEKGIEGQEIENNYLKIEKELSNSNSLKDSIEVNGFGKINQSDIDSFSKHKIILLKKGLFLRRLQNSQGKGTAYHDGSDEDFE